MVICPKCGDATDDIIYEDSEGDLYLLCPFCGEEVYDPNLIEDEVI